MRSLVLRALFVGLISASSASAQQTGQTPPQQAPSPLTPEQARTFVAEFKKNVESGCSSQSFEDKPSFNIDKYCSCYASSIVNRYQPDQLLAISNAASQDPSVAKIITYMLIPESQSCRESSVN